MKDFAFNCNNLREGDILHFRTSTAFGVMIRWALNVWARRLARINHASFRPVWGNHDAITLCSNEGIWAIGEALPAGGNVMSNLNEIEFAIRAGRKQVRVFRPILASIEDGQWAAERWIELVQGTRYDFFGYGRLVWKALVCDWADSTNPILKAIGSHAAGMTWRHWCTEGVAVAWTLDTLRPFDAENPTPMTVEQKAGLVYQSPVKRITLREVTAETTTTI